jgi:hypothetical protein
LTDGTRAVRGSVAAARPSVSCTLDQHAGPRRCAPVEEGSPRLPGSSNKERARCRS